MTMRTEQLEGRVMAVDIFSQTATNGIATSWLTIIANDGDDVYVQRAATKDGSLLVADNASFLNRTSVPNVDTYQDVFVTNAAKIDVLDQESDLYPLVPSQTNPAIASNTTYHVLEVPQPDIDNTSDRVTGIISNGVGGRWDFFGRQAGATSGILSTLQVRISFCSMISIRPALGPSRCGQ